VKIKTEGFQKRQTAITFPNRMSNPPSDGNIVGAEIDIEGNQEWPRTDGDGACGFMECRLSNIRKSIRVDADLRPQFFKASTPNIF